MCVLSLGIEEEYMWLLGQGAGLWDLVCWELQAIDAVNRFTLHVNRLKSVTL